MIGTTQSRRGAFEYLFAIAISMGTIGVTVTAYPERPFVLPFGAVVVAAWFGGAGPAAVSALISVTGAMVFLALRHPGGLTPLLALQALGFSLLGGLVVSLARARDRSQRTIRQQTTLLEAMLGQASIGIALVDLDRRLKRVNPRLADILGRTRETAKDSPASRSPTPTTGRLRAS